MLEASHTLPSSSTQQRNRFTCSLYNYDFFSESKARITCSCVWPFTTVCLMHVHKAFLLPCWLSVPDTWCHASCPPDTLLNSTCSLWLPGGELIFQEEILVVHTPCPPILLCTRPWWKGIFSTKAYHVFPLLVGELPLWEYKSEGCGNVSSLSPEGPSHWSKRSGSCLMETGGSARLLKARMIIQIMKKVFCMHKEVIGSLANNARALQDTKATLAC